MQKKRILFRVEEILLVFLILLNILDFFEMLPPDFDYIKKVISWTALGYLLYHASLTYIFFNSRHKYIDLLLIISYFMLIFKNIVAFGYSVKGEFILFQDFQVAILKNAPTLEFYTLIIGSFAIVLLAFYSAKKIPIQKPSLLAIFTKEGLPKNLKEILARTVIVYVIFLSFFIIVFNLIMEWLAIAIDAPLIMIGMLGYIYLVMRHYKQYNAERLIFKIGEFGEQFYEKFVSLFHYKNTVFLGISGMLVLHLLTDALSFIVPYILTIRDSLYFSQLGPGHNPLITVFLAQIKTISLTESIMLFGIYILNIVGMLSLLLLPSLYWFLVFKKKKIHFRKGVLIIIVLCILAVILVPVFHIDRLNSKDFVGVDLQTQPAEPRFNQGIIMSSIILLGAAFLTTFITKKYKKFTLLVVLIISMLFFTYYIYLFFTSQSIYYFDTTKTVFSVSGKGVCSILANNIIDCGSIASQQKVLEFPFKMISYGLTIHFILFFIITLLFYIVGFIMFAAELMNEKIFNKLN